MKEEEIVQKVNQHFGDQIPITKEEIADFCHDLVWDAEILAEARAQAQYPTKKAKEIALDAAVKIFICLVEKRAELIKAGYSIPTSVEKVADEIYQWLISDSIKQEGK